MVLIGTSMDQSAPRGSWKVHRGHGEIRELVIFREQTRATGRTVIERTHRMVNQPRRAVLIITWREDGDDSEWPNELTSGRYQQCMTGRSSRVWRVLTGHLG